MSNYSTIITKEEKRLQLKQQLDSFATFMWRGINMFQEYGVFIINEKREGLKFFNGPSFSNEYTKPMFQESNGNLANINYKKQFISFKIGMYYFSITEYQDFINKISPSAIDYITFDFDPSYSYFVRLANIQDSTRYIIGYEDSIPQYYTEMELRWEVQGPSCARSTLPYEFIVKDNDPKNWILNEYGAVTEDSLLDTPIEFTGHFNILTSDPTIKLFFNYWWKDNDGQRKEITEELFNINFINLSYNAEISNSMEQMRIDLKYNSETSLLTAKIGDEDWKLLNLITTANNDNYIVKTMNSKKYLIPGSFNSRYVKEIMKNSSFRIEYTGMKPISSTSISGDIIYQILFTCYSRVNVI